jgi:hypothetical protein
MASERKAFELLRAHLGHVLEEDEDILGVAQAWGGARAVTLFTATGPFLRWVFFVNPVVLTFGFVAGLVRIWVLAVTQRRLIAIRRHTFRHGGEAGVGSILTPDVRSFDFAEPHSINVTSSLWSGWLVEVKGGRQVVKYAVQGSTGTMTPYVRRYFGAPPQWRWTFEDFAKALVESSRRARR